MIPFDKCPGCGGEMVKKEVEKIVRGGNDTVIMRVEADVCLHCGERLFSPETIRQFEQIRTRLERHETESFCPVGRTFQLV